ncbi:MAG: DUF2490 domain-containing protein [Cyclobacteriaceae bacterium]|nr:DUF2490 domain-containing protein [Cyclobacteriaceae bacterium]
MIKFFKLFLLIFMYSILAHGQIREVRSRPQGWIGYMTSTRISDNYSVWNDAHFVPGGFYVLRTGLTRHLSSQANITAGYAFLGLPAGGVTKDLKRMEHRPWGQLVVSNALSPTWSNVTRIRYDARFRRNVEDGNLTHGYGFNHRLRFMASFRKMLPSLKISGDSETFVAFADEILVNFGRDVVFNAMDQNRVTITTGVQKERITWQIGYMNRFVQLASGNT